MRERKATPIVLLFLQVLRCFTSLGSLSQALLSRVSAYMDGFPHSEISGSKATNHLPEAYRRLVTSFIAVLGQGIHRAPLRLLCGNLNTTICYLHSSTRSLFLRDEVSITLMRIRMSKSIRVFLKRKNRPSRRFFRVCTRGPYGLSAPFRRLGSFGS